jgi:hypothetical protein
VEKLPRSAIKLLELETIPLARLSAELAQFVNNPVTLQKETSRLSFLGKIRGKGNKIKANDGVVDRMTKKTYTLDVVSWLRLGLNQDKSISLCLSYKDSTGEYVEIVDEQNVTNGSSVMLSGRVTIETKGHLQEVKVACAGLKDSDRCYVEDLSITYVKDEFQSRKIA